MGVSFEKFRKWAEDRFDDIQVTADKEIRINSIFSPGDTNHHMWCSPSGGKKKRKFGVYHCFKTDKKGSLVKLIQMVDSCDRDDALAVLSGHSSVRDLERRLEEFFAEQDRNPPPPPKPPVAVPEEALLISDLGTNNWWRKKAEEYLARRKIPIDGLYICTDGKYKARIIIPYYDRAGRLIYWNGRHIGNSRMKYRGPGKEDFGVGKEDVVFMAGAWPQPGELLYLCEGEFNAISMKLAELSAAACGGKNMGEKQAIMLSDYRIALCLDRDKAGRQGTAKMRSMVSTFETVKASREKILVVVPPPQYNDWNEMLVNDGPVVLHHYVKKNQQPLDYSWPYGTSNFYQ